MAAGIPAVSDLAQAQADWTAQWHSQAPESTADGLLGLLQENHWQNFTLWHHEDQARRDDAGAEHVCQAKRAIDRCNQLRNDAMEKIDTFLIHHLKPSPTAPLNSETPGMMLDRMSILALKAFHMGEETERPDVSAEHRAKCEKKLSVIRQQRADLTAILTRFFEEVTGGTRSFKVYFQFKMYNDPELNPQLYGRETSE